VGSVMCSYNRINGQYGCENQHLLRTILRKEWGFDGYVLADYGAAHNTVASLNNGLDFEPWPPLAYQPLLISGVLAAGLASTATLDEHVRSMLTTWFRFGLFDRAAYTDDDAQIDKGANAKTARTIAEQAVTLLKNDGGTLPLNAGKLASIAVIGKAATTFTTGGGSGSVTPFQFAAPLDAIRSRAGAGVQVGYADGSDASAAVALAKAADVAIVFAGDAYAEGADRTCLSLECPRHNGDQDALIRSVAAANEKTIVVLASGGPDLTPWRSQVAALVESWFGGAQVGPALAAVLFGDSDPGGRLPITFPDSEAQLPTAGSRAQYPGTGLDVRYSEGVLIGYRWYDEKRLEPAFPFGFGLSYTTSALKHLTITPKGDGATVTATVTNTGSRTGYAVPQLYVGLPQPSKDIVQPPAQLKGFHKLLLKPRQSRKVTFALDGRSMSYWDVSSGGWKVAAGCADVRLGFSSRDVSLRGTLAQGGAACPGAAVSLACTSRRTVRFTLPRGAQHVRLTVDGKRRVAKLSKRVVTLSLQGLPRRAVKVRITATVRQRRYVRVSVLHPCKRRAAA
ncbi:MAG: glycosyl hydrolase, partial [Solirubrobacterales bacterium]|nr:glycosyl hydrolase [Solirubrobacterales bacterium]